MLPALRWCGTLALAALLAVALAPSAAADEPDCPENAWQERAGPDFGAGPSVAMATDGTIHLAYVVYRAEPYRQPPIVLEPGLYYVALPACLGIDDVDLGETEDSLWLHEFVADVELTEDHHADDLTTTALAVDASGGPHIVFFPHPNGTQPAAIRYASKTVTGWALEDPAQVSGGPKLEVEDGWRSIPQVAVGAGRVVAAFQLDGDRVAVTERTGTGTWELVTLQDNARFPRLEIDAAGELHLAWFAYTPSDLRPSLRYGELRYAAEAGEWSPQTITDGIYDYSLFWETASGDGSFDFGLTTTGAPAFLWAAEGRTDHGYFDELAFATVEKTGLHREWITTGPTHGNHPTRVRLETDGAGGVWAMTGYGGTDLFLHRAADGGWHYESLDRFDMFRFDVSPGGRIAVVYTQPHGGTTVAVSTRTALPAFKAETGPNPREEPAPEATPATPPTPPVLPEELPGLGPLGGAAAALGGLGMRRLVTRPARPRVRRDGRGLRALGLAALLLLGLASTSPVSAQSFQWVVLVEDEAGDPAAAQPAPAPAPDPRVDLKRLELREAEGYFGIRLQSHIVDWSLDAQVPTLGRYESVVSFRLVSADGTQAHQIRLVGSTRDGYALFRDDVRLDYNVNPSSSSRPYNYGVSLPRHLLTSDGSFGKGDRLTEMFVTLRHVQDGAPDVSDRGPNQGFARDFVTTFENPWRNAEEPYASVGPSLSVGPDGATHLAYIVYEPRSHNSSIPDAEPGLYHAVARNGLWSRERVAEVKLPPDLGEERTTGSVLNTSTAMDVDEKGRIHILYHPHPNGTAPGEIRYALFDGTAWSFENPAHAGGSDLAVEDGWRAIPDLVASQGRVVATIQRGDGEAISLVERTAPGEWKHLKTFDAARFPRLAIGTDGQLHLAWFAPVEATPFGWDDGALMYAAEADGWNAKEIQTGIREQTEFWQTAEADGTFAFALGPGNTPTFVWESSVPYLGINDALGDTLAPQKYAILENGQIKSWAAPLRPYHGNPQLRMRMVVDEAGTAHVVTGYGGADLYGQRRSDGTWTVEEVQRVYMWDLDLAKNGRPVLGYLDWQPAVSERTEGELASFEGAAPAVDPMEPDSAQPKQLEPNFASGAGFLGGVAAMGGLVGLGLWGARASERQPRWVWRGVAALGLFSRLHKDELLDHKTRDDIVDAARVAPGRSAAELRRDLDLPRTTFFYHVRRLEKEGLIKIQRAGGQLLLFEGSLPPAQRVPARPTGSNLDRELVRVTKDRPGLTSAELAEILQQHPRTVHHRLLWLERRRLIQKMRTNARDVRWTALQEQPGEAS